MRYGFIIFMLALFTVMVGYSTLRGFQVLKDYPVVRGVYLGVMIFLFISLFLGMGVSHLLPPTMGKVLAFIGHTALIVFVYLFIAFLLVDIVRIINHFAHFAPEGMMVFRKWAFVATVAITAVVMIIGNYKFNHPKLVELEINLESETPQHKELRIVAASDIHLGVSINKKRLNKYVNFINEQQPDIVLLAGDLVDNMISPVIKQNMHQDLRKIQAPLGVYAIPGNHEYIGRDVDLALSYIESGNVRVLRDGVALVNDDFYVIGRDDRTNQNRKSIAQLTDGLDRSKPTILLDHQPYHLEEAEASNIDLQISGHTHDGQFFPFSLIVRSMYENPHGYSTRGKTHYYVSSGLGLWGPQYRIGTQSELVVITLKY